MKTNPKWYDYGLPVLFILDLLLNYLSSQAIFFKASQAEISDKYLNLLAPAGFTFAIWGLIYLGMAVTLFIPFSKRISAPFKEAYRSILAPILLQILFLNMMWLVAWSSDLLLIALIIILIYYQRLLDGLKRISATPLLRDHLWSLKYPWGLHYGWLIVATFANFNTYLVSKGFPGTGGLAVFASLVLILVIVGLGLYAFAKYGNGLVMVPILWALLGVLAKHRPGSDFGSASLLLFWLGIIILLGSLGITWYFYRLQKAQ